MSETVTFFFSFLSDCRIVERKGEDCFEIHAKESFLYADGVFRGGGLSMAFTHIKQLGQWGL